MSASRTEDTVTEDQKGWQKILPKFVTEAKKVTAFEIKKNLYDNTIEFCVEFIARTDKNQENFDQIMQIGDSQEKSCEMCGKALKVVGVACGECAEMKMKRPISSASSGSTCFAGTYQLIVRLNAIQLIPSKENPLKRCINRQYYEWELMSDTLLGSLTEYIQKFIGLAGQSCRWFYAIKQRFKKDDIMTLDAEELAAYPLSYLLDSEEFLQLVITAPDVELEVTDLF